MNPVPKGLMLTFCALGSIKPSTEGVYVNPSTQGATVDPLRTGLNQVPKGLMLTLCALG